MTVPQNTAQALSIVQHIVQWQFSETLLKKSLDLPFQDLCVDLRFWPQ